jgi:hypothetical protein
VIERVHRVPPTPLGEHGDHGALDATPLELHIQRRPIADELHCLSQRRNPGAVAKAEGGHIRRRQLADRHTDRRRPGWLRRRYGEVMVHDDDPVARHVHIELDSVGAPLERTLEGR